MSEKPKNSTEELQIEQDYMGIDETAQSKNRENFYDKLSSKQKEILESAELILTPSGPDSPTQISGEITIEGKRHKLDIEHSNIRGEKELAIIDGEKFIGPDAEEIFNFYYPIARAILESNDSTTEEYKKLHRQKLKSKLLGR